MGSTNSTEQVREFVQTNVTSVVQSTLISKATTVQAAAGGSQLMEGVTVLPPPPGLCPADRPPRNLVIGQTTSASTAVALTLTYLNAADVSSAVTSSLKDAVDQQIEKEKRDSLAFTDNTNVSQRLQWTSQTLTAVTATVEMKLNTYINATSSTGQTMRNITVYLPCGDTAITQDAMLQVIATDFAAAITETLMRSQEARDFVTNSAASDIQKATGTLTEWSDALNSMVGKVTALGGVMGIGFFVVVAVAVVILPYALYKILNSEGGQHAIDAASSVASKR